MWIPKAVYEDMRGQIIDLEQDLRASRAREDRLLDRLLTKTGSRPVVEIAAPVIDVSVAQPEAELGSFEKVAFAEDWKLELAEYKYGVASLDVLGPSQKKDIEEAWQAYSTGTFDPEDVRPI